MIEAVQSVDRLLENLNGWTAMNTADMTPHVIFQKSEQTVSKAIDYFKEYVEADFEDRDFHLEFIWSVEVRDFLVLLRDSLLSSIKYDQYKQDNRKFNAEFEQKLCDVVTNAAQQTKAKYENIALPAAQIKDYEHQISPLEVILEQIEELEIQLKKIYRSHDKINEIRINLESFNREFQLLFQKQVSVVHDLVSSINEVYNSVESIYPQTNKTALEELILKITNVIIEIEELQSVESMTLLSYAEGKTLHLPIKVSSGSMIAKNVSIQSEVSKWFSSNIYPHVIELENRRNLALEHSLVALNKVRIKLSALLIEESDMYDVTNTEAKPILNTLKKVYILPLSKEEEENTKKIEDHFKDELFASNVYNDDMLFTPYSGNVQMVDISRDAQKRMYSSFKTNKKKAYSWIRESLSKYIELDRTPFNAFIANKLLVNKDDERLSLFLKKGYLGKSFTVPRPDIIEPIMSDFNLWKEGFSGCIMLHGSSGVGKTALLGMLSQAQMNDDFISVKPSDPYFTKNKAFDGTYDLEVLVNNIAYQYLGKKIVLTIDDLEQWHSKNVSLFENISKLFDLIQKYRGDIFFIICCGSYLHERLSMFRDLDSLFSSRIEVGSMSSANIKQAIVYRYKALPELGLTDTEHENSLGDIVRISQGNIGHAMMEYCRYYEKDYKPNLKSQEFIELIRDHEAILKYILSFDRIKFKELNEKLNEVDYRNTVNSINVLAGHKVLLYVRGGMVRVNPFLIYAVESALSKIGTA